MQSTFKDFVFFFVPGSGGAFLNTLFGYYINYIQNSKFKFRGFVTPETGDCHNNKSLVTRFGTHLKEKIPPNKKIIAIDFDDDDKKFIFKMMFHKSWKLQLTPKALSEMHNGKYKHLEASNFVQLEKEMSENLDDFIFQDWKIQLKELNPALIVTYKQIMSGDINKVVADFFGVGTLSDAEEFVKEFRLYNSKYFVE